MPLFNRLGIHAGLTVTLYSLRLFADGHYVAVKEDKACTLPRQVYSLSKLRDVVDLLYKFKVSDFKALTAVPNFYAHIIESHAGSCRCATEEVL